MSETNTEPTPVTAPEQPPFPEPETGPTKEELLAAFQQERDARARAEQAAATAQQQAVNAWTSRQREPSTPEDPLKKIGEDFLTNPDAAAQNLRSFVTGAVREESNRNAQAIAAQMNQRMAMDRDQQMFNSFAARNPDLTTPDKLPTLSGEALRIKMEYEGKGMPQPPDVYLEKAAQAVRTRARVSGPPPAFVEGGASSPQFSAAPGTPQPVVPEQNGFEETYGMEPGSIVAPWNATQHQIEKDKFIRAENAERDKHKSSPAFTQISVRGD